MFSLALSFLGIFKVLPFQGLLLGPISNFRALELAFSQEKGKTRLGTRVLIT
jgi:uncharacterized protein YqgC (DUF456 family)